MFRYRYPETVFEPNPNPKNSPLGPQKLENNPKIRSNSKVRIERNIQNESCLTILVDQKTVVQPYLNPKNSPLGPQKVNAQKVKNDPNIKSKSNARVEGNIENEST